MNKFVFMGRLTKYPEVRYSGETAVARFDIAVDRRFKKDVTDFFAITAFGKLGEFVEKYLVKGTKVVVSGNVQNNNYTNKEGKKVYGFQFVAEEIEFAESKKAGESRPAAQPSTQPAPQDAAPETEWMNIPDGVGDEELPFI